MNAVKKHTVVALGLFALCWSGITAADHWANPQLLVDAKELNAHANDKGYVIVDCRDLDDYLKGHIPGAISFGQRCKSVLRDTTSRVFRDTSKYERLFSKVGIGNNDTVIYYYDGLGTLTDATVAFWVTELMGHKKVHVLNGGLDAWRKAGLRLDTKPVVREQSKFVATIEPARYAETAEVLQIAVGSEEAANTQLIDSRTSKENEGDDIRAVRGGSVPHTTVNIDHLSTLATEKDPKTGKPKPIAYFDVGAAKKAFGNLDKNKRTIAYCQTGTRSTMTYLQLRMLGFENVANWDESWQVYGSNLEYPVQNEQWFNFAGLNKKISSLEKKIATLEAANNKDKK
jgi:thiosulfate/3-mercaptopyruvate sulfurtransferase